MSQRLAWQVRTLDMASLHLFIPILNGYTAISPSQISTQMVWTGLTVLGEVATSIAVTTFMVRHYVRLSSNYVSLPLPPNLDTRCYVIRSMNFLVSLFPM